MLNPGLGTEFSLAVYMRCTVSLVSFGVVQKNVVLSEKASCDQYAKKNENVIPQSF